MNTFLFISLFSTLGIIYGIIGWIASARVATNADYFLAGRNLNFWGVTSTLIATQLGGAMLLGTSQWSYEYGLYGILYVLGMSLGFLLLASGFAARLQRCNVETTAQLFEKCYNSVALKKIASAISILSLWGILIMLVVASKAMINGLGMDNEFIILAFWAFIIVYTMIGGLKAVVLTDKFQLLFIIASIGGVFAYALFMQPAGFASLPQLFASQAAFNLSTLTGSKILATFLMPALFALIEQDLAQCFFAARSQRVAMASALSAGLFIILFGLIPVYFGMQAQLIGIAIPEDVSPFIVVLELITSDFMFVLVTCGIIAAITSTADTLMCAVSSNIAQDFDFSFVPINNKLRLSQAITFFVGVSAVIASYTVSQNIIDIAIASYELSVSCLLIPLLYALFGGKRSKNAALGAAVLGLMGFIGLRFVPLPAWAPHEIVTILLSWLGYQIGERV